MRKRWIVVVLVVAGHIALWSGLLSPLSDAWSRWLDGRSLANVDLWGRDIRWWGRFGKICIFFSGLSVALDLVDPDSLRDRGKRASLKVANARKYIYKTEAERVLRRAEAGNLERLYWLPYAIRETLVGDKYACISVDGARSPQVILEPAVRAQRVRDLIAREHQFTRGMLEAFHESVTRHMAETCSRHGLHSCKEICSTCDNLILQESKRLLASVVTGEDKILVEKLNQRDYQTYAVQVTLWFTLIFVSVMTLSLVLWAGGKDMGTGERYSLAAVSLILVLLVLLIVGRRDWPKFYLYPFVAIRTAAAAPTILGSGVVAALLDKARPVHLLRWTALCLFVMGSHFDILSS